jgi:glycerol 2-dehydrogenase (NADP+)
LSEEEFQQIQALAESYPPKRVCDQSNSKFLLGFPETVDPAHLAGFATFYDIYQENDPEVSDKVLFSRER